MAMSSFGPYHGLWHENAPTKRIDIITTPWMLMTDAHHLT
jgi:hypothetical protein